MNLEEKLRKYQGLRLLSEAGSGSFIFENANSFYSLESVQEAIKLTLELGFHSAVEFREPLVALKKRRAIPFNLYFRVTEGELTYIGLTPPADFSEKMVKKVQKSSQPDTGSPGHAHAFTRAVLTVLAIALMLGVGMHMFNQSGSDFLNRLSSFFRKQHIYEQKIKDANWERLSAEERNQVLHWLALADTLFKTGKLIEPKDNGALNLYEQVLKYHHTNRIAQQRRQAIYSWLIQKSRDLLQKNQIDSARELLELGEKHFKDSNSLPDLSQQIQEREQYLKLKELIAFNNIDEAARLLSNIHRENVLDDSLKKMWEQIGRAYLAAGAQNLEAGDLTSCRLNLEKAQEYLGGKDVALQLSFKALERAEQAEQERLQAELERQRAERQAREIKAKLESDQQLVRGISFFDKVVLDKVKSLDYRISKILLLDEFNSNTSGWSLENNSNHFFQIENGRLYMGNHKKGTSYWEKIYLSHRNILVRFDLRFESGDKTSGAGIHFRYKTFSNDYRYYISVDAGGTSGYYDIGFYDDKKDKGKWIKLKDWTKTDAIRLNKNNVVEAIIAESNIYLYINGKYITHVTGIENLSGNYIGFLVDSDSIKYSFDNLVVAKLRRE